MEQVIREILRLCQNYQVYRIEVEYQAKCRELQGQLKLLCRKMREKLDITEPEVLLAVMDAYEVTRDEEILQEVLDVVSRNLDKLTVSAESVRLLAYCYYYIEEAECADRAWEMVEELGQAGEDVGEVEKVVEEMVGKRKKVKGKK